MPDRAERSSVLFDLFAASQRVRSLLAAAMEGCGFRSDEYAVYSALVEFEPLSPTEMAHVVGMPRPRSGRSGDRGGGRRRAGGAGTGRAG